METAALSPEALFDRHQDLAKRLASSLLRTRRRHVTRAELESAALEGLWRASLGWRPDGGATFGSYAWPRIRGSMLDYLRQARALGRRRPTAHRAGEPAQHSGSTLPRHLACPRTAADARRRRLSEEAEGTLAELAGRGPASARLVRILRLRYLEGLTLAECGRRLGLTEASVHFVLSAWAQGQLVRPARRTS